jgi:hypothetical protein
MDDKRIERPDSSSTTSPAARKLPPTLCVNNASDELTISFGTTDQDVAPERLAYGSARKLPGCVINFGSEEFTIGVSPSRPVETLTSKPELPHTAAAQSEVPDRLKASSARSAAREPGTAKAKRAPLAKEEFHQVIAPSKLFDERWYRESCATSEPASYEHYLRSGIPNGISPSPLFDVAYYASAYPDIDFRRRNPLYHYLTTPIVDRIGPHPLFDRRFYAAREPRLGSGVDPFLHYVFENQQAARQPHPLFDAIFYISAYPQNLESRSNSASALCRSRKQGRALSASAV